jgi:methionyl-tRNA synthetase
MNDPHPTPARRRLVATAIPYVNAEPHLGFAFECVLADVLARHARARAGVPDAVLLASGTDDHALKNVVAAERDATPIAEHVARHAEAFRSLAPALGIAWDRFISTSAHPDHRASVEELWRRCAAAGDLRRGSYRGLYCAGCEAFLEPADLVDGACPEHAGPPDVVDEENWFFALGRYRDAIRERVEAGFIAIEPPSARAEVLAFLEGEVRDLSVSRPASRARGWGVPVPGDPDQTVYVWLDALAYYLTTGAWADADERIHVIGKGITRFHAVYWPAFLLSAGLPLPSRILVHGYLTVEGAKISKSGRSVDPRAWIDRLGVDAVRWSLARAARPGRDADVAEADVVARHDAELSNRIGNCAQRVLRLAEITAADPRSAVDPRDVLPASVREGAASLEARGRALPALLDAAIAELALDRAAGAIIDLATAIDGFVELAAPWALARRGELDAARAVVVLAVRALQRLAAELEPFLPSAASRLARALEASPPRPGPLLFPRLGAPGDRTLQQPPGEPTSR